MEGLELIAFEIISSVGTARSCYIEAISEAKKGNYEKDCFIMCIWYVYKYVSKKNAGSSKS